MYGMKQVFPEGVVSDRPLTQRELRELLRERLRQVEAVEEVQEEVQEDLEIREDFNDPT